MVTVRVDRQLNYPLRKFADKVLQFRLKPFSASSEHLDQSLHGTGAMHAGRHLERVGQNEVHQLADVIIRSYLEHFLAKVVSELVRHHIRQYVEHSLDEFTLVLISCSASLLLQSLLDHATPSLVKR